MIFDSFTSSNLFRFCANNIRNETQSSDTANKEILGRDWSPLVTSLVIEFRSKRRSSLWQFLVAIETPLSVIDLKLSNDNIFKFGDDSAILISTLSDTRAKSRRNSVSIVAVTDVMLSVSLFDRTTPNASRHVTNGNVFSRMNDIKAYEDERIVNLFVLLISCSNS
jgi:hypothetical protein